MDESGTKPTGRGEQIVSRGLPTLLVVLLYLALLAGRGSLGPAYGPVVIALAAALAGLGLYRLWRHHHLKARLRVDFPLLLLGGTVALAAGLRLLRAPPSAPAPGTGEAHFIEAALGIIRTGHYIPTSLRHPPLLVYGELAVSVLRFVAGASADLWTWPTELVAGDLYGWGRGFVALVGAATLVPVYAIARRRYGCRTALLAALFLSLLPIHAAASGIVTPEVPAALLVVLVVRFSLHLLERGEQRWALAAGACAGLATATYYPAGVALLVPLLAAGLRRPASTRRAAPPTRRKAILGILAAALIAFVVACPAVLFDLDRLVAGLAETARVYFPPEGRAGTGLRYLIEEGWGYGPSALVLLGLLLLIPRLRRQDVVLFAFPLVLYLVLLLPRARLPRDLVLLAPWPALLAAFGLDQIGAWIEGRWPDRPLLHRWAFGGLALLGSGLFLLALI